MVGGSEAGAEEEEVGAESLPLSRQAGSVRPSRLRPESRALPWRPLPGLGHVRSPSRADWPAAWCPGRLLRLGAALLRRAYCPAQRRWERTQLPEGSNPGPLVSREPYLFQVKC